MAYKKRTCRYNINNLTEKLAKCQDDLEKLDQFSNIISSSQTKLNDATNYIRKAGKEVGKSFTGYKGGTHSNNISGLKSEATKIQSEFRSILLEVKAAKDDLNAKIESYESDIATWRNRLLYAEDD
jgi:peptidoglycan hydrolase CwlO-like protein